MRLWCMLHVGLKLQPKFLSKKRVTKNVKVQVKVTSFGLVVGYDCPQSMCKVSRQWLEWLQRYYGV